MTEYRPSQVFNTNKLLGKKRTFEFKSQNKKVINIIQLILDCMLYKKIIYLNVLLFLL